MPAVSMAASSRQHSAVSVAELTALLSSFPACPMLLRGLQLMLLITTRWTEPPTFFGGGGEEEAFHVS